LADCGAAAVASLPQAIQNVAPPCDALAYQHPVEYVAAYGNAVGTAKCRHSKPRENQMIRLGQAYIRKTDNGWYLEYLNSSSFLTGERWYADAKDAREFCYQRRLQIVADESR
jgi:hypothetical protein